MAPRGLTVGEIAKLSGLTVRTLHHYEAIGLVVPGARTEAGYRLYGRPEIERLQEVLFFRELGFGLDEIRSMLEAQAYDRTALLSKQRELLLAKTRRLARMIEAIDAAIATATKGTTMTNEKMLEVFGDFDPAQHEDEARERWGDTDAYRQSVSRTARYTKTDWQQIGGEAAAINDAFIALMRAGIPPTDDEARSVAEQHRAHISKWFYECTPEVHAGLGRMYVEDERFTRNIDRAAPGLARYMSAAMTR
jgi:DNA-binding transcriptional MerR regulator